MVHHDAQIDSPEPPDADIVSRVVAGDRDAYALLVNRYSPVVGAFLIGRGLRSPDLDVVVQDAFVRVYRRIASLRRRTRFSSYLMRTASRCFFDHRRRTSSDEHEATDLNNIADRIACDVVACQELQAAIALLPESMQIVLGLKYTEGRSAAEIANVIGHSVNSVTKTLSRAYERLRNNDALRRAWEEGE